MNDYVANEYIVYMKRYNSDFIIAILIRIFIYKISIDTTQNNSTYCITNSIEQRLVNAMYVINHFQCPPYQFENPSIQISSPMRLLYLYKKNIWVPLI